MMIQIEKQAMQKQLVFMCDYPVTSNLHKEIDGTTAPREVKAQSNYLFNDCLSSLIFCWVISPREKSKTSSLRSCNSLY